MESDSMVLEVFVNEERRYALKVCDFDFGEKDEYDDDRDYKGSEALEKKVTSMQRKGQYDQAAFIRLLQASASFSFSFTSLSLTEIQNVSVVLMMIRVHPCSSFFA